MKIVITAILCAVLMSSSTFSYYYHICIWKEAVNDRTHKPQIVVGFADFHDKNNSINQQQQLDFDQILLKKLAIHKGKLIVEDLSSANNDGKINCCNFGIKSEQGVLGRLADKARKIGVDVDNVEYRFCRVAAMSPLLNKLNQSPHLFQSAVTIDTASLHKEVIDEINRIKNYDDGRVLNVFYKNAVAYVSKALLKLNFYSDKNIQKKITVADYCSNFFRKHYKKELEKLCIFDSALIDMKILHSIVTLPKAPYVFIAAGGAHIQQMNAILKKIGYELVFATPQPLCINTKTVVNTDDNAQLKDIPEPIDIAAVSELIH